MKKILCLRYFPTSFAKYFRKVLLQNTSDWLLLTISTSKHHTLIKRLKYFCVRNNNLQWFKFYLKYRIKYNQIHNFERYFISGEIKLSTKVFLEKLTVFTILQQFKISVKHNQDQILVPIIIHFLKGYLRYKTIFCNKVALDAQLMNFFIWNKNNVSFSRYLDFCVSVKSTNFKICDVMISIAT